uniref:peptidylprolyl isomerase n=1 Tax=Chromera velia CCMP2878 TaxID=1169474 RepID=A0A0G4FCB9_9ALVE|eukprot:Cvel_16165.t1-p1 / transcript=Cvel_16165.t1 / gene=Cvel_16165 / organism=Chromera_velia_CCMP2878 / gene_product=Peptidyl-prolyl cis-trans isomerase A, putative / transcript_product=Peptidyl-prolyl cis-trans isomerase A, putative / location=Cvel_scaffold1232:12714-13166(+) / protein_length=151 / sequence_SO=supercontig / SO=protein_coding / is_pseudo=false
MVMTTRRGVIRLRLRPDAAPVTTEYIKKCIGSRLYDGRCFYRSDFVIQCGLHGSNVGNPHGNLPVNETASHVKISNIRGTAAIAHWDVPDCGNTEFFINLKTNAHLDTAYGGYCVFATVDEGDAASFSTIDAIAQAVAAGEKTVIESVTVE